jgi:hypothetical protein
VCIFVGCPHSIGFLDPKRIRFGDENGSGWM